MYNSDKLYGLSRDKFIEALRAEGMEIGAPSAPVLANTPLYSVAVDPLFSEDRNRNMVSEKELPTACLVEREALSLPTFYDWKNDKPLIDQYIKAFEKVEKRIYELVNSRCKPMKPTASFYPKHKLT